MRWLAFIRQVDGPTRGPALRIRAVTCLLMLAAVIALFKQPAKGLLVPPAVTVLCLGILIVLLSRRPVLPLQYVSLTVAILFILSVVLVFLLILHRPTFDDQGVGRVILTSAVLVLFWAPLGAALLAGFVTPDPTRFRMVGKFRINKPRRTMFLIIGLLSQIAVVTVIGVSSQGSGNGWNFWPVILTYGSAVVWALAVPFYIEGRALGQSETPP